MNLEIIVYVFVAMAIITWIFWMVKKGYINPEQFNKPRQPQPPNKEDKEVQVEIIK